MTDEKIHDDAKLMPEEKGFKRSDAYIAKTDESMLELKVRMIHINLPTGYRILRKTAERRNSGEDRGGSFSGSGGNPSDL